MWAQESFVVKNRKVVVLGQTPKWGKVVARISYRFIKYTDHLTNEGICTTEIQMGYMPLRTTHMFGRHVATLWVPQKDFDGLHMFGGIQRGGCSVFLEKFNLSQWELWQYHGADMWVGPRQYKKRHITGKRGGRGFSPIQNSGAKYSPTWKVTKCRLCKKAAQASNPTRLSVS